MKVCKKALRVMSLFLLAMVMPLQGSAEEAFTLDVDGDVLGRGLDGHLDG